MDKYYDEKKAIEMMSPKEREQFLKDRERAKELFSEKITCPHCGEQITTRDQDD